MKDLSNTPVYVDSVNGSDSNSGFSAAESVKTFARAMEIGNTINHSLVTIVAAGGSYSGPLHLNTNQSCIILMSGDITINGRVTVLNNSVLFFNGDGRTVTITAVDQPTAITVWRNSYLCCDGVNIKIKDSKTTSPAIIVDYCSVLSARSISLERSDGNTNTLHTGIGITNISYLYIENTLSVGNILSTGQAINIASGSGARIDGSNVWLSSSPSESPVTVSNGSYLNIAIGQLTIHNYTTNNKNVIVIGDNSRAYFYGGVIFDSSACNSLFSLGYSSYMFLSGTSQFSGTATTAYVVSSFGSAINISASANLSKTATATSRSYFILNGTINVNGGGANKIPGTTGAIHAPITVKDINNNDQTFSKSSSVYY